MPLMIFWGVCQHWYAFEGQLTTKVYFLEHVCSQQTYEAQLQTHKPLTEKLTSKIEMTCLLDSKSPVRSS